MFIKQIIDQVSSENMEKNLYYLCRDPLPFRTVLYHRPWHERSSLQEADDFIVEEMQKLGVEVNVIPNKVRPFRCNPSKPLHHWYDSPAEDDPWYDAANIEVIIRGTEKPEEIIQLISHKDSPSWINSPGAYDDAVGVCCNMEIVRIIAAAPLKRTVRILFCNEEHTPWHSRTYAMSCAERGDNIIAVINTDSISGGLTREERATGLKRQSGIYSTPEGKVLAEYITSLAPIYVPGLETRIGEKMVNDDDGSFVNAGFPCTIMAIGSSPFNNEEYHLPGDIPENVDMVNLTMSVKLILAAVCAIGNNGIEIINK